MYIIVRLIQICGNNCNSCRFDQNRTKSYFYILWCDNNRRLELTWDPGLMWEGPASWMRNTWAQGGKKSKSRLKNYPQKNMEYFLKEFLLRPAGSRKKTFKTSLIPHKRGFTALFTSYFLKNKSRVCVCVCQEGMHQNGGVCVHVDIHRSHTLVKYCSPPSDRQAGMCVKITKQHRPLLDLSIKLPTLIKELYGTFNRNGRVCTLIP